MATSLDIESNLLEAAMRAGGHKTKKAAVTQALIEYVLFQIIQLKRRTTRQPEPTSIPAEANEFKVHIQIYLFVLYQLAATLVF